MTEDRGEIATLLLAAGASTRMGSPKQLLRLGDRSLLRRAAEAAIAIGAGPVLVVVGSRAEEMLPELRDLPVEVVRNARWEEGLGTSVAAGAEALERAAPPAAVLITLADQPGVDTPALQRMVDAFRARETGIEAVASGYGGVSGVPAIFEGSWLPRLRALDGDRGAGALLRAYPDRVRVIALPEAANDVDTPGDLEDARRRLRSSAT